MDLPGHVLLHREETGNIFCYVLLFLLLLFQVEATVEEKAEVGGRRVQAEARVEDNTVEDKSSSKSRSKSRRKQQSAKGGAVALQDPPHDPKGPGELGKPVKFDNPEPDVKAAIDKGWQVRASYYSCSNSYS